MKILKLLPLLVLLMFSHVSYAEEDYVGMSIEELTKNANQIHPSGIYVLAEKLLNEGKKDDAVFWFYVGQIRFRAHLMANPNLNPSGDPAIFNAFNYKIGAPINKYAGKDPKSWASQIKKAKKWDEENPNKTTPKKENAEVYKQVLAGLDQMVQQLEKM